MKLETENYYKLTNVITVYEADKELYAEKYDVDEYGELKNRAPVKEDFIRDLSTVVESEHSNNFIPANVIYQSGTAIMFYTKKQKHSISIAKDKEHFEGEITIPWLVWRIDFISNTVKLRTLAKKPTGPHDKTYEAPFPNIMSNESICWGQVDFDYKNKDTETLIKSTFELFFNSTFNNHGTEKYYDMLKEEVQTGIKPKYELDEKGTISNFFKKS